jgi:hypothetical protein
MADTVNKSSKPSEKAPEITVDSGKLLVVDIDKRQSRKRIRKLRKGRGPLMDRIHDLVADLREEGSIDATAQPLVIVVREKRAPFGIRW